MNRKGLIICVDDEQTVLDTLQEQLSVHFGETHRVMTASSGEDAYKLLETIIASGEDIVELIISDQVMPGMKGDEFLKKAHELSPDTIKILLTGHAGLDSAINAINYGGLSRYIEKPWDIDKLKDDIQQLIDRFREKIENQYLINNLEARIQELETKVSGE